MLSTLLLTLAVAPAVESPKIHPALVAEFEQRMPGEKYRVYAVLGERLSPADLEQEGIGRIPRGARQAAVTRRLMTFAAERQVGLRTLLADLADQGLVENVEPLWITNSMVFRGTRDAIERVAALPEVERIGWDPPRAPEEYADAGPGRYTTYYSADFEGGTLPPEFTTASTGCGWVNVTGAWGPYEGSYHCVMGATADNCTSTAELTLTVNLAGVTTAKLRYALKDMNDEFDPGLDILEASDDGGVSWVAVADLTGSDGAYLLRTHSLDGLGLTYGPGFLLRWRWADNYRPQTDGFGIDLIQIADDFPPPPPPTPEPNLVQLQATDLWALGYDGTGALIVNIDSGTDYNHPDLAGRIWTNPLDPPNGIDDDGNGYIDDVKGWDFYGGENDPMDEYYHGTCTAGIMVGDGASGIYKTGMAPGAQLAICRIDGETDHWLAQQWAISVGADCSSSSYSYKWAFVPKPDYHMHREVTDMVLAAGLIHANSIGNQGSDLGTYPIPFNISAPGICPAPWSSFDQTNRAGVSSTMGCGAIRLDDSQYSYSGRGPGAWEDITLYDASYPWTQRTDYWDYPFGGFGGGLEGLIKPDVVTYTEVVTPTLGGGYQTAFGGTSAATPHLGGALALLCAAAPFAEPRHICQALQLTAEDMGAPGKDNVYGAGKVQVRDAALRLFHTLVADDITPSLGDTIVVTAHGFPLENYTTGYSFSLGSTVYPIFTADLAQPIFILAVGTLDGAGQAVLPTFTVPVDPALIGLQIHVQSTIDDRGGITGQYLLSTVESITVVP